MAIKKYIFDSFYRYSGSNNKPKFIIPNTGIVPSSCYVSRISIPHSFYNINSNNNKLFWTDNNAVDITSTMTPGNYTIDEFLAEIGTQMTTDTTDAYTYSATKNSKTSRVTITNSGPANFDIRFVTTQECPACFFVLLGFYETENDQQFYGDYNRIASLSGASSYTAKSNYFMNIRNIYVRSNIVRQTHNYSSATFMNNLQTANAFYIGTGMNDILVTLPVVSEYGDFLTYDNPNTNELLEFRNRGITEVEFELVSDDNFDQVDLNGRAWTIEIVFIV